jgi:hypothetical protein
MRLPIEKAGGPGMMKAVLVMGILLVMVLPAAPGLGAHLSPASEPDSAKAMVPSVGHPSIAQTGPPWSDLGIPFSQDQPGFCQHIIDDENLLYDPVSHHILMFDASTAADGYCSSVLELEGGQWTFASRGPYGPPGSPYSLSNFPVTYDAGDGYFLAYGGAYQEEIGDDVGVNMTWEYQGGNWTELFPLHTPDFIPVTANGPDAGVPAKDLVYDAADNESVLLGPGETWAYHGGDWVNVTSGLQPPYSSGRYGSQSALTYDSEAGDVLMFDEGQTWVFSHGTWTNLTSSLPISPPAVSYPSLSDDPAIGGDVLFGGTLGSSQVNYTWLFSGGSWTNVSAPVGPSPRYAAGLGFDPQLGGLVLWGGFPINKTSGFLNDTWEYGTGTIGPTITSFTASPDPTDVGISTTFTVSASGGTLPFSYNYTGLPAGCVTVNLSSFSCKPSAAGTHTVRVFVNDSLGNSTTATLSLTVNADTTVSSFTALHDPTDVGIMTTLNVTASGGIKPYTYTYTGLPGCVSENTSSLACDPLESGTYVIEVFVNDTRSPTSSASASLTLTVDPVLSISQFYASPDPVDAGVSTTFNAIASGGTQPYSYAYAGLPSGCSGANTTVLTCTPTTSGTLSVRAYANDSVGESATDVLYLTVDPHPYITSFTATPDPADVGTFIAITAAASGGNGYFSYTYTGLPAGCASTGLAYLSCVPIATGAYTVRVFANDTFRESVTSTLSLIVNIGEAIVSYEVSPGTIDLGQSVIVALGATGGSEPFTYAYSGLPAGCRSLNSTRLSCTPRATGQFPIRAFYNDSAGESASTVYTLTVNPALDLLGFNSQPSIMLGARFDLIMVVSGGTLPYEVTYRGLPPGCYSAYSTSIDCVPSAAGSFTIKVFVNDTTGSSNTTTVNLLVKLPPPPLTVSFLGLTSGEVYTVLVVIMVAIFAAMLYAARRLRKTYPPRSEPPKKEENEPPGPAKPPDGSGT